MLIATDPDADRVGIAVNTKDGFQLLTGNEVGVLLTDFTIKASVLQDQNASADENSSDNQQSQTSQIGDKIVMSTIVSSSMLDVLAKEYGFELRRTLTGFKYIGEQIAMLEDAGQEKRFAFGFEESYGYLPGTYVRDKDAVATSALICNMARFYKSVGLNLVQVMESLYLQFGYYKNAMVNIHYKGAAGAEKMGQIMDNLRSNVPSEIAGLKVVGFVDYAQGVDMPVISSAEIEKPQILPKSNVLEFQLEGENKLIVRPSGTEPKIKGYLFGRALSASDADKLLSKLDSATRELLS